MAETKQTNAQIESLNELTSPPSSLFKDAWTRLSRNKGAVAAILILSLYFVVAVIVPSLTFLGDGVGDVFDPRLKGA